MIHPTRYRHTITRSGLELATMLAREVTLDAPISDQWQPVTVVEKDGTVREYVLDLASQEPGAPVA